MRVELMVAFLLAGGVLAGEEITIDDGSYQPPPCESNVYRWNGAAFECLSIDRVDILSSQRDVNKRAYDACRAELTWLRAERVLDYKQRAAEEKCRELGKAFDDLTVECGDPLPQKERESNEN